MHACKSALMNVTEEIISFSYLQVVACTMMEKILSRVRVESIGSGVVEGDYFDATDDEEYNVGRADARLAY